MTLDSWKNKGAYFDYHTHQIFHIEEGRGDVLLLIHGFPTASWDWWQMWNQLTSRYRVITLDMIGFGFSDKPRKHPYSIFDQADLIEHFLDTKQIKRIQILSHDYGDTAAQELLARQQDRTKNNEAGLEISSLCLLNGGLFPETHQPLFIQKLLMSPVGSIIAKLFTREKLGKNFKRIFGPNTQPTEKELDAFWTLINTNGGKYVFHRLIRYMQERKDHRSRWVGALQKSNIPIRLIDGTHDPISGQHMVDRYQEIIPNPDVIELHGIGHFPLMETPDLVLKHYFEFVRASK